MAKEKSRRKPAKPVSVYLTMQQVRELDIELTHTKDAAARLGVSKNMIIYWASRGYIKKYYIYGNSYNYEVDYDEVAAQPSLGYDRLRQVHNKNWALIPRTANNSRWTKKEEGSDEV